jgi:transposase
MSRLNLTPWQKRRLRRQLAETRDARLFRRTLAVLEFDHGRCAADIARMLGVTRHTVYDWIETYTQDHDPASLEDQAGRGRPPLLDEDQEHLLEALLAGSPQDYGYPHVGWTLPLLQEVLEIATELRLSQATLRRALHRMDYLCKRPRYDLVPDPEREKKMPDPPANPGPAAAQRGVGPGRDRPVAVPAVALRLVEARRSRPGLAERPQGAARDLRGDEPADRDTAVRAAPEGTQRRTSRRSSRRSGRTTGVGTWPSCSMRTPATRRRPPCVRPRG